MFKIDMLPADEGDALWIEYGPDGGPVNRFLIDCGRKTAYRKVADRLEADPDLKFEIFVLTHVDADHIAGAVPLLQDGRFGPERVGDVWFNGWRHLNGWHKDEEPAKGPDILGAKQGEFFGAVLRNRDFRWNDAFGGNAVVVEDDADLPVIELPGGMKLTLLAPTWPKLKAPPATGSSLSQAEAAEVAAPSTRTSPPPIRETGARSPISASLRMPISAVFISSDLASTSVMSFFFPFPFFFLPASLRQSSTRAAEPATIGDAPDVPPNPRVPSPVPELAESEAPGAPSSGLIRLSSICGPRDELPTMDMAADKKFAGSIVPVSGRIPLMSVESAWLIM